MSHAIVRTDNLAGIYDGSKLVTFRFYDNDAAAAIDNGNVVSLAGLDVGETKIFKAVAPAANQKLGKLVLVATPELIYEKNYAGLEKFENPEGAECRGYVLCQGDTFSVTKEALDAVPTDATAGIEIQADTKFKVTESLETTSNDVTEVTAVAELLCAEVVGNDTFYKFRVL